MCIIFRHTMFHYINYMRNVSSRYLYNFPLHVDSYKARWHYLKEAYPGAETIIHGASKSVYLSDSDYYELLMKRGFPLLPIKKKVRK